MRVNDITGMQSGHLTAVRPSHKEPKKGTYWLCRCSGPKCGGKGTRKVLAKDFRQQKIKRCIKCADPVARRVQAINAPKRWSKRPTGPMYSQQFRESYKDRLKKFNPAEQMLFDLLLDGRTSWQYVMQVVDLVQRSENLRFDIEQLITDSPKRWQRYLERQRFKQAQHTQTELKRAA